MQVTVQWPAVLKQSACKRMGKKQTVRNYVATSTNGVNSAGHVTQGDWLSSANLQAIFNRQAGSTKQLLSLCYFFHLNCCPSINRPFACRFTQLATAANKPSFDIIWIVVPCYKFLPIATALLLRNIT